MIFSENRYPLFGIMLLSTSPPPRQPLISRAAGARVMAEPTQICKFCEQLQGWRRRAAAAPLCLSPCPTGTGAGAGRINTPPLRRRGLRQLGNHLVVLGFRPGPHRSRADIAERADLHAELGDIIAAGRLHDADKIELAVGQVGLLDVDAELLGRFLCSGGALGCVLDVTDSLFGPVHHDNEGWHDQLLPLLDKRDVAGAVTPALSGLQCPSNFAPALAALDFNAARAP